VNPRVIDLFAGVDHILHAGDIGPPSVVMQLERVAPVTAVRGNCDSGSPAHRASQSMGMSFSRRRNSGSPVTSRALREMASAAAKQSA